MGDFLTKKTFYNRILLILGPKVKVKNLWTKVPKGTPLHKIWPNKLFGVCASRGVLTLCKGKSTETRKFSHREMMSSITLQPLPRHCN